MIQSLFDSYQKHMNKTCHALLRKFVQAQYLFDDSHSFVRHTADYADYMHLHVHSISYISIQQVCM